MSWPEGVCLHDPACEDRCARCAGCLVGGWLSYEQRRYCSAACLVEDYRERTRGCDQCGFEHEPSVACPSPLIEARGIAADALERIARRIRR